MEIMKERKPIKKNKFTHLHVHSHYSLLDGLAKIDELIEKAKELGMDSLALTDHGAMYGAIEFYRKAIAAGIKPIIGSELYIVPGSRKNSMGSLAYISKGEMVGGIDIEFVAMVFRDEISWLLFGSQRDVFKVNSVSFFLGGCHAL